MHEFSSEMYVVIYCLYCCPNDAFALKPKTKFNFLNCMICTIQFLHVLVGPFKTCGKKIIEELLIDSPQHQDGIAAERPPNLS